MFLDGMLNARDEPGGIIFRSIRLMIYFGELLLGSHFDGAGFGRFSLG